MIFTQYHHYTTDELIRFAVSKLNPTPLEQELLKRLMSLKGKSSG